MTAKPVIRVMSVLTSRPVVVFLYLLTLFLWSAMFFYLVPAATGGWFGPLVSVAFGVCGVAPMVYLGLWTSWRVIMGKPLVKQQSICPTCGQPLSRGHEDEEPGHPSI